jgi:hypothetical protein
MSSEDVDTATEDVSPSEDIHEPEFANDSDINQEVPVERANTLERVREDYDRPWVGTIVEAIQNGGDAFGTHKEEKPFCQITN